MKVFVKCPIHPTEERKLVSDAVTNLFPDIKLDIYNTDIFSQIDKLEQLDFLRQRIFAQRIIDAVRAQLLFNAKGVETKLRLDKQMALYGRVRLIDFDESPPLGCISLLFEFSDKDEFDYFINWFTPPTEDGMIVG